jgi:hypothetical protein
VTGREETGERKGVLILFQVTRSSKKRSSICSSYEVLFCFFSPCPSLCSSPILTSATAQPRELNKEASIVIVPGHTKNGIGINVVEFFLKFFSFYLFIFLMSTSSLFRGHKAP